MMEKKPLLILNGIHGAGKTSHGRMLEMISPETYSYYPETGGQLRREVDYNVLESGIKFDLEVMKRETERDQELQHCSTLPVVETWHIGNLAYIMQRSPELIKPAKENLEQQLAVFEPFAVLLTISWEIFKQRYTEDIDPEELDDLIAFCGGIFTNVLSIYDEYDVPNRLIPNDGPFEESFQHLLDAVDEHTASTASSGEDGHPAHRLD